MCTWVAYLELSSGRRSDGIESAFAIQSAWPFSTCVTSASTLRPNFWTISSGSPAGCASFDHSLKYGFRTTRICLVGANWTHLYGPVPGGGRFTCLAGVPAGSAKVHGIASWSRNSGSTFVRWNVMSLPLITIPCERSHVLAFFRHAAAPLMTLYQLPAFGLVPILKRRSNVALMSCGVSVCPFENLIPVRSVNL